MNRMTNKELPAATPTPRQSTVTVKDTLKRAIQHEQEEKEVRAATGFLDRFLRLFADYSHHSGRSHKRKLGAVSTRSPEEIIGELRAFQQQRPRPWRPAGCRPKPVYKTRYRYRRAAA